MSLAARLARAQSSRAKQPEPKTILFGDLLSDLPPFGNPGATMIRNVIPGAGGYLPLYALTTVSDALNARVRGAYASMDVDGVVRTFAGTASKLYQIAVATATDVSAAATTYDLGDAVNWSFVQYGNTVIATYFSTGAIEMQRITLGGANFASFVTSSRKPRGKYAAKIGDFLMLAFTYDATDGSQPQRVWWSAIGDPTDFTPAAATQCDYQDLDPDDGWITGIYGGKEYALIFQERAITRMTYTGSDVIFQRDKMVTNNGCACPGSIAGWGRSVFYLGSDGFYMFDGTNPIPIGAGKIDVTFTTEFDTAYTDRVSSAIDPVKKVYVVGYPTLSADGTPDKIMAYYAPKGKWSDAEVAHEWLFRDLSKGLTLDDLDTINSSLDLLTPSLDSRVWTGGAYLFAAFTTAHRLADFSGSALTARLETGEEQPYSNRKAYVGEIRPLVDGATATTTIQLGTRELHTAAISYGTAASLDADGKADFDVESRYLRARVNISGGFDHAQGIQAMVTPGGAW